jgi:hypothetical protein
VRNQFESITVRAAPKSVRAKVSGSGEKLLDEGVKNVITIGVENENGDSKTYTITAKRLGASVKEIENAQDMEKIGVDDDWPLAAEYVLMNNITLENWKPIIGSDNEEPFSGVFDGNDKTITLKSFRSPVGKHSVTASSTINDVYVGIFGSVAGTPSVKAEIKDLKIRSEVNTTTTDGQAIGLLAGYAENVEIDNVTLSGQFAFTSSKTLYLGGVVGLLRKSGTVLKNSSSSLVMNISPGASSTLVNGVIAYDYVGGFVGLFYEGAGIENCHNTGNITADNVANSVSGQVFVGGITGGSPYAFNTDYKGYVQDCSYIGGTVIGRAKGSWTWAGGIAATIVGGNVSNDAASTRIERCFVKNATISVEGATGGFIYIGGIVAYNYYGALVSQCYFEGGTVIAGKAGPCGGVVGYNSQTSGAAMSRVENCWSSGTVQGFTGAGGVVAESQVNTYTRKCYSIAKVEATNTTGTGTGTNGGGVGGVVGQLASTAADACTGCVALNPSITAAAGNMIGRVTGSTAGTRSNNYALSTITPSVTPSTTTYVLTPSLTVRDGADIPGDYLSGGKPTQAFYQTVLGWDVTYVWKMGSDGYPKLKWQK